MAGLVVGFLIGGLLVTWLEAAGYAVVAVAGRVQRVAGRVADRGGARATTAQPRSVGAPVVDPLAVSITPQRPPSDLPALTLAGYCDVAAADPAGAAA